MARQDFDAFRNSTLHRKTGKKKIFKLPLIGDTGNHHGDRDSFYPERRKSSSMVARVIFIIIILHVLIIGSTFVHKKLQGNSDPVAQKGQTPPPSATIAKEEPLTITPLPVAKEAGTNKPALTVQEPMPNLPERVPAPVVVNTATEPAHITTAPTTAPTTAETEIVAVEVVEQPAPQPSPKAQTAALAPSGRHLVLSGEGWGVIASKYGITEQELQAANPRENINIIFAGEYLNIPQAKGASAATAKPASTKAKSSKKPKVYIVKKGDIFGRIAQKNNISMQKLMKINNMTEKQASNIKIGQAIKLEE